MEGRSAPHEQGNLSPPPNDWGLTEGRGCAASPRMGGGFLGTKSWDPICPIGMGQRLSLPRETWGSPKEAVQGRAAKGK